MAPGVHACHRDSFETSIEGLLRFCAYRANITTSRMSAEQLYVALPETHTMCMVIPHRLYNIIAYLTLYQTQRKSSFSLCETASILFYRVCGDRRPPLNPCSVRAGYIGMRRRQVATGEGNRARNKG